MAADSTGVTAVPGLWVAGNVSDMSAQVVVSAAGMRAGAMINADLVMEDARLAVAAQRSAAAWRASERTGATAARRRSGVLRRALPFDAGVWSGRPDRQLVVEAAELPPGTALDAGCGEGADALGLGERGWLVTAVDLSLVALDRATAVGRARGSADRIEWRHEDLDVWPPPEARFDLVSAHYLHATWSDRPGMFSRLATAVAPGGTLLVVGHVLGEEWGHGQQEAHHPHVLHTAEDLASLLDPEVWREVVPGTRERDPEAVARTANHTPDTVLVARRRSGAR